jgi:ribosome biogenesis protein Tsr3
MRTLSVGANLIANTATTLFTCPLGYYAKIVLIRAVNKTGSNKHISLDWTDTSASATYSISFQQQVTSLTTNFDFGESYMVLEEGDTLRATSESGSTFTVIATIELEGLTRL